MSKPSDYACAICGRRVTKVTFKNGDWWYHTDPLGKLWYSCDTTGRGPIAQELIKGWRFTS